MTRDYDGPRPVNYDLTRRELEVLSLVAEGMSNARVARELWIASDTVKTHMRRIAEKLDAPNRTAAAVKAIRLGLIA